MLDLISIDWAHIFSSKSKTFSTPEGLVCGAQLIIYLVRNDQKLRSNQVSHTTKFEVSISTHYEDVTGDGKCRKTVVWGSWGHSRSRVQSARSDSTQPVESRIGRSLNTFTTQLNSTQLVGKFFFTSFQLVDGLCRACPGFVDGVIFSHDGSHGAWRSQYRRGRRASASCHQFPTCSPWGTTLFDFVVVYNGSKLHTGAKSAVSDCLVFWCKHCA